MKRFIKGMLLLFIIFFNINVQAEVCDHEDFARMKELVKLISANYKYVGDINYNGNYQLYEVDFDFNGLGGEIEIGESNGDDRVYHDGEKLIVESGKKSFSVYYTRCSNKRLYTFSLDLPKFNEYSMTDPCNTYASGLEICDKWYQGKLSVNEFNKIINEYSNEIFEEESNFFDENGIYIIIISSLVVIVVVILFVKKIKKNKLD